MNSLELRYEIYKHLVDVVYGAELTSPVPGEPVQIGAITRGAGGEFRKFTITIEEE